MHNDDTLWSFYLKIIQESLVLLVKLKSPFHVSNKEFQLESAIQTLVVCPTIIMFVLPI